MSKKRRANQQRINDEYRNGGDPAEDRDGGGRDLVGDMELARRRPDILANDLARMGYTDSGDEAPDAAIS